jgi:hypothetical protein
MVVGSNPGCNVSYLYQRISTVVRKFAILVSFGILVVFMALELQANARVWYFL